MVGAGFLRGMFGETRNENEVLVERRGRMGSGGGGGGIIGVVSRWMDGWSSSASSSSLIDKIKISLPNILDRKEIF